MKLQAIVGEAGRSLRATMSTTVAATLTVLIGMFVLGLSIAFGTWLLSWSDHLKQQLVVKVFFHPGTHNSQVVAVENRLKADTLVKHVAYISAKKGFEQMQKEYPAYANGIVQNPLGPALTVYPKDGSKTGAIAATLNPRPASVDTVTYGRKTANAVLRFARAIEITFVVAVVVLLAAAILMIGNTIRLSIFARRREIEVMKLVGATNWFVRGPFMVEGFACGLMARLRRSSCS